MVSLSVASLNTHRSVRSPLAAEQLRPPPAPAASALYPDARGNERERLMGRIPRMPMGPLTSQPARHPRSRSSRRRRRRARRGPGLLPPGLEPRKRCGRAVDGQHPHAPAIEEHPHRRPGAGGQAPIGRSGRRWRRVEGEDLGGPPHAAAPRSPPCHLSSRLSSRSGLAACRRRRTAAMGTPPSLAQLTTTPRTATPRPLAP